MIVPWKPLPLETPATFTVWPFSKASTTFDLAHLELAGLVAELADVLERRGVGLLEVAQLGLGQALLLDLAERELHGLVAVALVGADGGDEAGARLDDGDALDAAVLLEYLGHTELLSEQSSHGVY